jgi:hypothetical protein
VKDVTATDATAPLATTVAPAKSASRAVGPRDGARGVPAKPPKNPMDIEFR